MKVPRHEIRIPDYVVVQSALPLGYMVRSEGPVFIICLRGIQVGSARIENDLVVFEFFKGDLSEEFKRRLGESFPAYDPERIVWQIFIDRNDNAFTFIGGVHGYATAEQALADAHWAQPKADAFLCSVKACNIQSGDFVTETCQKIVVGDQISVGPDLGSKRIRLQIFTYR